MTESATQSATQDPEKAAIIQGQTDQDFIRSINEGIAANTADGEVRISRLAMLQSKSPEIEDQQPGYLVGQIVDNITREVLSTFGPPPWLTSVTGQAEKPVHYLPVAIVFKLPTEYIKWIKKEDRKPTDEFPWEFKTLDLKDPRVQQGIWKSKGGSFKGKKPPVTDNSNFLLLALDLQTRLPKGHFRIGTFSRTSAPCGQSIATALVGNKTMGLAPWHNVFYLYTKNEEFEGGKCYTFQLARGPRLLEAVDPVVENMCKEMAFGLINKETGHLFQTMLINSAHLDEGHAAEDGDGVSSGNSVSGTDDPFADPSSKAAGEAAF